MTEPPYLTTEPRRATVDAIEAIMGVLKPWLHSREGYDAAAIMSALVNVFAVVAAFDAFLRASSREERFAAVASHCVEIGPAAEALALQHLAEMIAMQETTKQ